MTALTTRQESRQVSRRVPISVVAGSPASRGLGALGVAVLIALAIWGSATGAALVGELTLVCIYATAISGLNLATGYTGQLSVGHSAFFGLGAYVTGILVVHDHWNPLATFVPSVLLAFVVGLVVGLPSIRIRGIRLAVVTLALAVAFPELVNRFTGLTGGSFGLDISVYSLLPPHWTGISVFDRAQYYYWISVFVLGLALLLTWTLVHSRAGLAMKAVRDREIAAASVGVNLAVLKMVVFGISAAVTAVAGSVFAIYLGSLSAVASFNLLFSITLIIGLVIGGVATVLGPLLGGVAVFFIPHWTASLSQGQASGLIFGVVLVVLIFLMPEGIAGFALRATRRIVRIRPRAYVVNTSISHNSVDEADPLSSRQPEHITKGAL